LGEAGRSVLLVLWGALCKPNDRSAAFAAGRKLRMSGGFLNRKLS
jgi:hypothetical protein